MNTTDKLNQMFRGVSPGDLRDAARGAAAALLRLHDADAQTQAMAIARLSEGSTLDAGISPLVSRVMMVCVQNTGSNKLPADRLVEAGHVAADWFGA